MLSSEHRCQQLRLMEHAAYRKSSSQLWGSRTKECFSRSYAYDTASFYGSSLGLFLDLKATGCFSTNTSHSLITETQRLATFTWSDTITVYITSTVHGKVQVMTLESKSVSTSIRPSSIATSPLYTLTSQVYILAPSISIRYQSPTTSGFTYQTLSSFTTTLALSSQSPTSISKTLTKEESIGI